ncbi:MAG: YggS family pyridoxal phosphate-dependent enzyme [Chloroflexales bacterium]|nr:YggS family pyridoxal phosphate-dependent enzyme [Chloroflexales bacterium]
MSTIAGRIEAVRERIARATTRAGRDPAEVTLVAVTKTHPLALVAEAVAAGAADLGENRVQEAQGKIEALAGLRPRVRWHLIGHLQRNKARPAAALFDLVHSVDSLRLAEALARQVAPGHRLPILLQVNVSGEASKDGFALQGGVANRAGLAALLPEVEAIVALPALEVRGLMTVAPIMADPEAARPTFRALRDLRDELARRFSAACWAELSMGMTDDFEAAIAEGATIVRVGRAIFGAREG